MAGTSRVPGASSPSPPDRYDAAARGFSRKAGPYEERIINDPVDAAARKVVRGEVLRLLPPRASILEINGGTGADAAFFAQLGHSVVLVDVAEGMVTAARERADRGGGPPAFVAEMRSFTDLTGIAGAPFDMVFSNFGGLNCTDELELVGEQIAGVLKPGGHAVLVVMPRFCPWEHAQLLRGRWRTAVRRWRRGGSDANVEGVPVPVWYHGPGRLRRALGSDFRRIGRRGLLVAAPPLAQPGLGRRRPRLHEALMRIDGALGRAVMFRSVGDFVISSYRYEPSDTVLQSRRGFSRLWHRVWGPSGG